MNKTTYDVVAQDLWNAGYYDCKFYVVPNVKSGDIQRGYNYPNGMRVCLMKGCDKCGVAVDKSTGRSIA